MQPLLLATNNSGKLRELKPIFASLPIQLVAPADLALSLDVDETGMTYAANAQLKAEAFVRASGMVTLADDSGLEVDVLGGAPGVYSARYAGYGATDADRRAKLMRDLHNVASPRTARFRCVIAVAQLDGVVNYFEGVCPGEIIFEERGSNGFGYDPIFYLPEYGGTMAELPSEVKNKISHRARAAQAALPFLRQLFGHQ
ncbi:MAG: RdgB/HAM1 family non-canonical purine NTP pyrophosphatase [Anaerolineales bacterium]